MCKNEKMVEIKQIGKLMWKIEKTGKMNIPVVILASEELIEAMKTDSTLNQAVNMSMLPGVLKNVVVLSDAHQGYGACIGGVVAYDLNEGVISPGEIGYDINCSVRLLKTNLKKQDIMKKQKETTEALYRKIHSGVGRGSRFNLTKEELKKILKGGAKYMVEKGYGIKEDYINTEEKGNMKQENPDKVSERAMKRGIGQRSEDVV